MAGNDGEPLKKRVAIVTDSVACLPPEVVRQYGVRVVPLVIYFEGKSYREGVDISAAEAYALLAKAPDQFTTSPGSAGDYLEAYRELSAQYTAIVCITLSSKLSTLYNMARVARDQAETELPGVSIEVVDSMTAAAGETLVVLAAVRGAAEGKDLAEVVNIAETTRERVTAIGIFQTMRHVYRTGRVPKFASQILSSLSVKPLFSISGTVHINSVDTNKERGLKRLLTIMREKVGNRPVHVAISHANVPDEGERLRQWISAGFNCVELWLTDFSPIMGYATGEGTLVIGFYAEG